jgi:hypothetical protein
VRRLRPCSPPRTIALLALGLCCAACGDDAGDGRKPGDARPDRADARAGLLDAASSFDASAPDARAASDADAGDHDGGNAPRPVVGDDYVDFGALLPDHRVLRVQLDVPADAFSLVVTADPGLAPRRIALLELRGPDGDVLFDANVQNARPFDPASAENAAPELPYSWMLPSSPALALEPGRYQVAFHAAASAVADATVHVDAVLARGDTEDAPRPLQLTVWSVPGAALDAQAAAADPQLQAALAVMAELYSAAGIELAQIAYKDLDGADAESFATLDGDVELALLLAQLRERAGPERALDLVLVDELVAAPGTTVLAEASGVPGPPAHPALARRGAVIVPLASLPSSAARAGALLAHECAHYLGLRHTTEYDGQRHDPLADTLECPPERATHQAQDGTPLLSAEDCADLDGSNLLFYTPPQSALAQDQLTADQTFVLARNPLLR